MNGGKSMKCRERDGAKKEKNNSVTNDGVYIELFAIKNGIRYNAKIIEMKDMANILTNSLMDGIENLWK